jgi:hypothetical protein
MQFFNNEPKHSLDFKSSDLSSKFIRFLENRLFRQLFGVVVFFTVFIMTMALYSDPYYLIPLITAVLYIVIVYRRGRRRIPPGEYRIKPGR